MAGLDDERTRLRVELDELDREITDRLNEVHPGWQIVFFRYHIPIRLNSTGLSWIYVVFNFLVFAFGITVIFFGDSWTELGIALVVGAMFATGSFVAQILSAQLNSEQHTADLVWRDDEARKVRPLVLRARETYQRLSELAEDPPES